MASTLYQDASVHPVLNEMIDVAATGFSFLPDGNKTILLRKQFFSAPHPLSH
jgi:hypothetical protein